MLRNYEGEKMKTEEKILKEKIKDLKYSLNFYKTLYLCYAKAIDKANQTPIKITDSENYAEIKEIEEFANEGRRLILQDIRKWATPELV